MGIEHGRWNKIKKKKKITNGRRKTKGRRMGAQEKSKRATILFSFPPSHALFSFSLVVLPFLH